MAEPRATIDAAVLLLNTDPLLRAARDITVAAMRGDFESDPKVRAAATVIVASHTPPDDPTVIQLARMVASPGAEDTAADVEALDLGALEDVVRAEYGNGRASGDRMNPPAPNLRTLAEARSIVVRHKAWFDLRQKVAARTATAAEREEFERRTDEASFHPEAHPGHLDALLAEVDRLTAIVTAATSRWLWTVAADRTSATLHFRTPGQSGFAMVATVLPREDGMLSVRIAGQAHTAADDLPAALATIRAVLGGDVPDLPNERSES